MAILAVNSGGTTPTGIMVNGSLLGDADFGYTTVSAAISAAFSGDTIVITEEGAFDFGYGKVVSVTNLRITCADNVRPTGDKFGDGARSGSSHWSWNITAASGTTVVENVGIDHVYPSAAAFTINAASNLIVSRTTIRVSPGANVFMLLYNAGGTITSDNNKAHWADGAASRYMYNRFGADRAMKSFNDLIVLANTTTTPNAPYLGYSAGARIDVVNCAVLVATGANTPSAYYTNCVAHASYTEGYNMSNGTDAPGTVPYNSVAAADFIADATPATLDMHVKDRDTLELYPGADVSSECYESDLDGDNETRGGEWFVGADWRGLDVTPTDPADLISAAVDSVFQGGTAVLRSSYDRWEHDGNAAGGIDQQRRPTVTIANDASNRLGVNSEPKFVTIIESPVMYVGMGDGSAGQQITIQQFVPDRTGIILEHRYGVDRKMREATPYMSAFEGNQKNLHTIDSFPVGEAVKNWQSTAPSSFRLTATSADAQASRATPASGNQDKIYEQQELAELIAAYETHPQESKLREIRYITYNSDDDNFFGTATTTEQRRRLPSTQYQGSNYTEEATEVASLYTINKSTGVVAKIADYNGSFWDSALIKQMHLLMYNQDSSVLYGIMPPGSHQQYLDTAEAAGDDHIGTLVTINKTTAEITEIGAIYWTPGTGGLDQIEIKNINYDPFDTRALVLLRTTTGGVPNTIGHQIRELDVGTPAISTSIHSFVDVTYASNSILRTSSYPRAFAMRSSGQAYVLASKGIGEMQNPKRHLHAVDFSSGGLGTEIGVARQTTMDTLVNDGSDFYAVDVDKHELVQVHENFSQPGVFERDLGSLVVDVFDTGATEEVVYTRLNVDNARAMDYHDIMVVTLEADQIGELLQIEFGSAVSKIDGRSPVFAEPGRQPDLQVQRVNFRQADKQMDVYININGSTFGGATRDEMRYIGFRVKDARVPFTFKVSRIQLMKLDPDVTPQIYTPNEFLEANKQFVQFSADDRRQVRWFVQFRAILLTEIPPISPKLKDAVTHTNETLAVINHPHRRLRGGRTVTPHLNDSTLEVQNAGWSQAPAKINGAYISDGYGVDPNSEPIQDPELFFGSGGAVVSGSPPF